MTTSQPPLIKTRLKSAFVTVNCLYCKTALEYAAPAPELAEQPFTIQCCACAQQWLVQPATKGKAKRRRLGTQEKPLDLSFYEVLGVTPQATSSEIKSQYRKLSLKHHPDRNLNDPKAGEVFREIAIAYATLSDENLRHAYNEFGKGKGDGGGNDETMVDPEAMFSQLFGGEKFVDMIGTLSLGREMKTAMQEDDDEEETPASTTLSTGTTTTVALTLEEKAVKAAAKAVKDAERRKIDEEKARIREIRVKMLVEKLRNKIALFTEVEADDRIASGVRAMWTIEAEELKQESYGVELLNAIGFVYSSKSSHFLASTGPIPFGLGGWYHSIKSSAHIVSETVSTARSAYALKDIFQELSAAETSGLSEEAKKELQDKAALLGVNALFKGASLEVESVIREVCDRLLSEENVPTADLKKRAVAIGILGQVFESVKKDKDAETLESMLANAGAAKSKPKSTKK